jgi:membrane protease YdiL (CAAX protease family)
MSKVYRFIALTFGISWLVALILYIQGIPNNSQPFNVLLTLLYFPAPGIAALVLGYFDKQPLSTYINWSAINWRRFLWLPLIFLVFIISSLLVVYLLGNVLGMTDMGILEWSEGSVQYRLAQFSGGKPNYSKPIPLGALWLFLGGMGSVILAGLTINALKSFMEELGWRGYLYKQVQHWGLLKSSTFIGLINGIWFMPLIALGFNFPDKPFAGMGLMLVFCIISSLLLVGVREYTQSVLGSTLLAGMIKGCAMLFFVYVVGGTPLFSTGVGIAGIGGLIITTALFYLLFRRKTTA